MRAAAINRSSSSELKLRSFPLMLSCNRIGFVFGFDTFQPHPKSGVIKVIR